MIFAERTNWELNQNRLSSMVEQLKADGIPFVDLTESNPTHCHILYPAVQICQTLWKQENIRYEPTAKGLMKAREAVSSYYAKKNIEVNPERIFLTASTSEAYSFLFRLLVNPHEKVLLPQPSYPLFDFLIQLNDIHKQTYPLISSKRWMPDWSTLSRLISDDVKAIVFVNPNNPTGTFIHEQDMSSIIQACGRRLPVICDSVFEDYAYQENTVYPTFINNPHVLSFVLGGVSKTLALPQMKISWIIVSGPDDLVQETISRLEIIADTYLSVNTPAQNALEEWFLLHSQIHQFIMNRINHNRQHLVKAFASCSGSEYLQAEGGWYAILKLPDRLKEEDFILSLLGEKHVLVHPGYFYDFLEEPYVVVSLLIPEDVFGEGIKRILEQIYNS